MTLKTESQHTIEWSVMANRNVELKISREGEQPVEIDFPANNVSLIVSDALMAAAGSFDLLKKSGEEAAQIDAELPAIPVEKVALAPSNVDGFKTLVLEIGEAQIGFALPDAALAQFGNLLLSISKQSG